jgi:hypothetical protein
MKGSLSFQPVETGERSLCPGYISHEYVDAVDIPTS